MKQFACTLLTLIILLGGIKAQPLQTQRFTVADGLSDNQVLAIMQDSYGLLWIGTTNGGLMMYDGYTFKVFKNVPGNPQSLLQNQASDLLEDGDENIWVATRAGVSKYIRAKNIFINYDFEEIFPDQKDVFSQTISFSIDEEQNLWLSTVGIGMVSYDPIQDSWKAHQYQTEAGIQNFESRFALSCVFDKQGRLWSGLDGLGLMWFDTSDSIFKPAIFSDTTMVPDFTKPENTISFLYTDPTGIIWITGRGGVFKYNPETHYFKLIQSYTAQKLNFFTFFNKIRPDNAGNIWIANNIRGVLKFDGISDDFEKITFKGQSFKKDGVSNMVFNTLAFDRSGVMWLGALNGLIKYDPQRAIFKHYLHHKNDPESMGGNQVFGLAESIKYPGHIYVGLRGGGLNLFDPQKETFKKIPLSFNNDLFGGSIRVVREEKDGTLWLGSWGDGLLKMDKTGAITKHFEWDSSKTNSLPDNLVRVLEKDANDNYWVGTNLGLCYLNTQKNTLTRFSNHADRVYQEALLDAVKERIKNDTGAITIRDVGNDANKTLDFTVIKPRNYLIIAVGEGGFDMADYGWITDQQGKEIWSAKNGVDNFHLGGGTKNRLQIDIQQLRPGRYTLHYKSDESHAFGKWNDKPPTYLKLWGISLIELPNNAGSQSLQQQLDQAKHKPLIAGKNIRSVHVSVDGTVWIGSDAKGLNRLDPKKGTVKTYTADPTNPSTLSDNSIQYIHESSDGILWLATNGGLNRFDPKTEQFKVFTEDDGLPTNYIASILPAGKGSLWLSTRKGLSKMITSPSTGQITFVNYGAEDGLGGSSFIAQVALKSKAGSYYFGGDHGLNTFNPTHQNEEPPVLYLSDIKVGTVSLLSPKSAVKIDTTINDLKTVQLAHDQNDLTFFYAALHFSNPAKNQYAHRLMGYDKNWIYDNKRTTTYTNLDPGTYSFAFKGSNRDGVWNDAGKSIRIIIAPPWWQTWWAYIGYGLIFLAIIFGVDRIQRRRLLARSKEEMRIREMEMRAETAELQAKAAEAERRALQAENKRKTEELEEARQLQFSMLPKELPQLPNLDIAVYMQTATEVGGDYYDFHVGLDGTLTVVIGDATGHGMRAGTMVTTAKTLFKSYAANPDILFSFQEFTRCIREMNFGKLSMCLTMLKIKGDKMQISTAGMPPSFIFRKDTRVVEEHLFQAMPLGTMAKFPYELKNTTLKSGDTILLMSDGLPELTNTADEMYGYKRIRNGFEDVADKAPEEIISFLKKEGASWANNEDPDDDVTFVVLKMK